MIKSESSSPHHLTISQRYSLHTNQNFDAPISYIGLSDVLVASNHSIHTCLSLLPEVLAHFPWTQTIFMAPEQICQSRILISLIVRYPHHLSDRTIIIQDAFSSFQWSCLLANQLDSFLNLYALLMILSSSHTHRNINNSITLCHNCWLWFKGYIGYWHVISINICGTRYWYTHYPQVILDSTQYITLIFLAKMLCQTLILLW